MVASSNLEATLDAVAAAHPARPLVITDVSRGDLIVGLAAAHASAAGPHVSAILAADASSPDTVGKRCTAILKVHHLFCVTNACAAQAMLILEYPA